MRFGWVIVRPNERNFWKQCLPRGEARRRWGWQTSRRGLFSRVWCWVCYILHHCVCSDRVVCGKNMGTLWSTRYILDESKCLLHYSILKSWEIEIFGITLFQLSIHFPENKHCFNQHEITINLSWDYPKVRLWDHLCRGRATLRAKFEIKTDQHFISTTQNSPLSKWSHDFQFRSASSRRTLGISDWCVFWKFASKKTRLSRHVSRFLLPRSGKKRLFVQPPPPPPRAYQARVAKRFLRGRIYSGHRWQLAGIFMVGAAGLAPIASPHT